MWWWIACAAPDSVDASRTVRVGPEGGVVEVGDFSLRLPAGALTAAIDLTVTPVADGWEVDPSGLSLGAVAWASLPDPEPNRRVFTETAAGLFPIRTFPSEAGVDVPIPQLGPVLLEPLETVASRPEVIGLEPIFTADAESWTIDATVSLRHAFGAVRVASVRVVLPTGEPTELLNRVYPMYDACFQTDAWSLECYPHLTGEMPLPPWTLLAVIDDDGDPADLEVVDLVNATSPTP